MTDELVRRAAAGDTAAFRALVDAHATVTLRMARVLLRERMAAEDAVQEAWVDVWHGLSQFRADQPFRPWLLTVVANRCRKSMRKRVLPIVPLDVESIDGVIADGDAAEHALRKEADAELRRAVAALPNDQQRILELRYLAHLELAEIATVMETPVGTVKSRLHRALARLRAELPHASLAAAGEEK